jgi:Tol biopolymer transport system component
MIMKNILLLILALFIAASCNNQNQEKNEQTNAPIIGKHELKLESGIMTPEVLWSFGRVSGVEVSPDGSKILYGVSYYSVPENKGNRELFIMNADGSDVKQLTKTAGGEYNAIWKPDGSKIAYMCAQSGSMQMWEMNPDGSDPVQVSDIEGGIGGFKYAPDMSKVVYIKEVKLG